MEGAVPPPFAFFSLDGERFKAVGMPADSAREVGYFRDAVLEIARSLWLDQNPGRKKLPDGFSAAFDLRLTSVEPGSARPHLVLHRGADAITDEHWDEWVTLYFAARDEFTHLVQTAGEPEAPSPVLANRALQAVRRVGSSLSESEEIVVGDPEPTGRRATLNQATRRVFVRPEVPTQLLEPTEWHLEGVVTEYDGVGQSFQLQTNYGVSKCVIESFNVELANFVRDVLALDGITAPDVVVTGETLDAKQSTIQLFNVSSVRLVRSVEEKLLSSRLDALYALEAGWDGPDSLPPSLALRAPLELALSELAAFGVPVDLMPTGDGAIKVELKRGSVELTAELIDDEMTLISDNLETDELREAHLPYSRDGFLAFLRGGLM